MSDTRLFPVFNVNYMPFFVPAAYIPPVEVCFPEDDKYSRTTQLTQYLSVPVTVPNYLALCRTADQKPWGNLDEIEAAALRVERIIVIAGIAGAHQYFFIDTKGMAPNGFVPSHVEHGNYVLNMHLRKCPPGMAESFDGEKIGDGVFADFKAAGYEPVFDVTLVGSFSRQLSELKLADASVGISGIWNIETKEFIKIDSLSGDLLELAKSVKNMRICGAQLYQQLA